MANHYEVPNWAGKPPTGLHLDVMKGDKLIQKLMLDEKRCYLFGRNPQMNDFCIDHASCSRVHSAFVYHKHLNRAFLVDLGSTHGTYIGSMRLESQKPTQLPINSVFHFGASTRNYVIRERPSGNSTGIIDDISVDADGALLGLPETQTELDNMTEFNTAHNRRISMLGITTDDKKVKTTRLSGGKKQKKGVSFNEDVDIINPEDIDPTIGRFRNLVKTTIVPMGDSGVKRLKLTTGDEVHSVKLQEMTRHMHPSAMPLTPLYSDLPAPSHHQGPPTPTTPTALTLGGSMSLLGTRLGLSLPNPAPDVDMYEELRQPPVPTAGSASAPQQPSEGPQPASNEPKKKIYAKEAWPGRKPALLSGV